MVANEQLAQIDDISEEEVELLEAVGVDRITALARSTPKALLAEMIRANLMLRLLPDEPQEEKVIGWVSQAKRLAGHRLEARLETAKPVQSSATGSIARSLPEAIPISPKVLLKRGIEFAQVPEMQVLELEDSFEEEAPISKQLPVAPPQARSPEPVASVLPAKTEQAIPARFDKSKPQVKRAFDENGKLSAEPANIAPLEGKGRQLINAPRPETNEGKKEHSRSYIRGVLHPRPWQVRIGAMIAIVAIVMAPMVFVALGAILLYPQYWQFIMVVPAISLVAGILYAMFATKPRCRICGQPLFVPKRCFRHVKAHRFPLLGYIVPTSLQLLLFKWFRCIFCGTAIRLKE